MRLYHCFSKQRPGVDSDGHSVSIFAAILKYGLLCSHERVRFGADPTTERPTKLAPNSAAYEVSQSRVCFTLLERDELLEKVNRAPTSGAADMRSHMDIFGDVGIGLDPLESRPLGVIPTSYFYSSRAGDGYSGIGEQIAHRLLELQSLCAVLARVEARVSTYIDRKTRQTQTFPDKKALNTVWSIAEFEPEVRRRLDKLSRHDGLMVFELFNTDRVRAADLHDFLGMMLSSYQSTDNTIRGTPLEFFTQREWRIVYHNRHGLEWFPLHQGNRGLATLNTLETWMEDARRALLELMTAHTASGPSVEFIKNAWVLARADGRPFRSYIREVVAPSRLRVPVENLLHGHGMSDVIVHCY